MISKTFEDLLMQVKHFQITKQHAQIVLFSIQDSKGISSPVQITNGSKHRKLQ